MADPGPRRPADQLFPMRRGAITTNKCMPAPIGCGKEAKEFKDALSSREYRISGLCQTCQDSVFEGGEE